MNTKIYHLFLHEHVHCFSEAPSNTNDPSRFKITVLRVPGGWIYYPDVNSYDGVPLSTGTFVPFRDKL